MRRSGHKGKIRIRPVEVLLWITGSLLFAVSVNVFTVSGGFVQGGITGLSLMLNKLFSSPVGTTMLILNIPLFFWAYLALGFGYVAKTAAATFLTSAAVDATALFLPAYTGDRLLSALFAGVLSGIGLGLICASGATTGGSDLVGFLLSKRFKGLSVGKLIFIIDAMICFAAIFVYRSIESGMYAIVLIYISSMVMDAVLDGAGISGGRIFFVVTDRERKVGEEIGRRLQRGVTELYARGTYSGKEKSVLMCAVRRHEISRLYSAAYLSDPDCFILVCPASDIRGFGFN